MNKHLDLLHFLLSEGKKELFTMVDLFSENGFVRAILHQRTKPEMGDVMVWLR
jgi:hypothetical protein